MRIPGFQPVGVTAWDLLLTMRVNRRRRKVQGGPALLGGRMNRLTMIAIAAVAMMLAGAAQAAPIAYQESVSGDLPTLGPLPILNFDVGANTVTGQISG